MKSVAPAKHRDLRDGVEPDENAWEADAQRLNVTCECGRGKLLGYLAGDDRSLILSRYVHRRPRAPDTEARDA
jgi:hypothetical protein